MNEDQGQNLRELKKIHVARLQILETQAAKFGISAPPHVLLEIQELRDTVMDIDSRLDGRSDMPNHGSQPAHVVKILFLAANPSDSTRLRLDEESRSIEDALDKTRFRQCFELKQRHAVRASEMPALLLSYAPDIVHFSGHGSSSGEIVLEDDLGTSSYVSKQALSDLFAILGSNVRCVVLNACYSQPQADAIAEHVDCVVGTSGAIEDRLAIKFASAFYLAIGHGRDIATAVEVGRIQIELESDNPDEPITPHLVATRRDPSAVVLVNA